MEDDPSCAIPLDAERKISKPIGPHLQGARLLLSASCVQPHQILPPQGIGNPHGFRTVRPARCNE